MNATFGMTAAASDDNDCVLRTCVPTYLHTLKQHEVGRTGRKLRNWRTPDTASRQVCLSARLIDWIDEMRGGITEHLTSPHLTAVSCPLCFCYIFDISVESRLGLLLAGYLVSCTAL